MCIRNGVSIISDKRYAGADKQEPVNLFHDLSFENISRQPKSLLVAEKQEFDAIDVAYGRLKYRRNTPLLVFCNWLKLKKKKGNLLAGLRLPGNS